MSKVLEVILRILVVISFICIIVFVCVAIINNQSIAYEGYNYIVSARNKTNFKQTQSGIENDVKTIFRGDQEPYAHYMNLAVKELNDGIDFYLDYLSLEDRLNKGEQDKLIKKYKLYIEGFNEVKDAYFSYLEASRDVEDRYENDKNYSYAVEKVNAKSVFVVKTYIECYKKGSEFFKTLVNISNKYTIPDISYQTYKGQSYMIKVGFVDYSLDTAILRLNTKLRNPNYCVSAEYNPDNRAYNPNSMAFLRYTAVCNSKLNDKDYLTNSSFRNFTQQLNDLNIFEWAGNFNNYYSSLSSDLKAKAEVTKDFYNNTYA